MPEHELLPSTIELRWAPRLSLENSESSTSQKFPSITCSPQGPTPSHREWDPVGGTMLAGLRPPHTSAYTGHGTPSLLFVWQNLPTVYDLVFHQLSPVDLVHVSWTCKDAYNALHSYKRHAFSINRLLSRFFEDPRAFRSLQARTGTVISGSQALQFFGRWHWPSSDLDIYTFPARSLEVGQWLESQGYYFTPSSYQPPTFMAAAEPLDIDDIIERGEIEWDPNNPVDVKHEQLYAIGSIRSVYAFEKETSVDTLKIQIIAVRRTTLEVILKFHSTAVMNFISWNKAYSLYPYATLEKLRSLICFIPTSPNPRYDKAMVKYHDRGFTMVADLYTHEDARCAFRLGARFVGDEFSMVISIDTDGVTRPDYAPNVNPDFDQYLLNGWDVNKTLNHHPTDHYTRTRHTFGMETQIIHSSILQNIYTAPRDFMMYARPFLIGRGFAEHAKLSPSEALMYAGKRNPKPEFWEFYDEELFHTMCGWTYGGAPAIE